MLNMYSVCFRNNVHIPNNLNVDTIYCHVLGLCANFKTGSGLDDWMIGFIDTLHIELGTTGNYSAIVILHTLQFTVTHAIEFSVFTSRFMATDL
jgi:hypothetical protein